MQLFLWLDLEDQITWVAWEKASMSSLLPGKEANVARMSPEEWLATLYQAMSRLQPGR
jgi:hypothetical protein